MPIIEIHDLHLSVKDVLFVNDNRTQALYTTLRAAIEDYINTTHFRFNDTIEDTVIWAYNKNGSYPK